MNGQQFVHPGHRVIGSLGFSCTLEKLPSRTSQRSGMYYSLLPDLVVHGVPVS